jgi:hypothetical protein
VKFWKCDQNFQFETCRHIRPNPLYAPEFDTTFVGAQVRGFGPLSSIARAAQVANDTIPHSQLLMLLQPLISAQDHELVMLAIQQNKLEATRIECERVLEAAFGGLVGCIVGKSKVFLPPGRREEIDWISQEMTQQV